MNAINVIAPYKHLGMCVFDDPKVGLTQEPFVAGADTMIDSWVKDLDRAEQGFRLIFSASPFPGFSLKLIWRRSEMSGNTYYSGDIDAEAWLCPALLKYFDCPPAEIY